MGSTAIMTSRAENRSLALLPPGYRASGILLHVTSLPGRFGIGDLGPEAHRWIDRLAAAGQSWWQILPLGPCGQGNSPYDPLSTFAGNPLLISPEKLYEDGLLGELPHPPATATDDRVDFPAARQLKEAMLAEAWQRFQHGQADHLRESLEQFTIGQAHWLRDFATFAALKEDQGGRFFFDWPDPLKRHEPAAVEAAAQRLRERIDYWHFVQFLFFRQWWQLRAHAQQAGIRVLGDLPFFVSHDSSEVWAHPELFLLDTERMPRFKAGVPPDYFSATGQLWGNPVYDWPQLQSTEYRWWVQRLVSLLQLVDGVRLDHFRAFSAAYHIPADAETAEQGEWVDCPGTDLIAVVRDTLGGLPFIAEDLGLITEDVRDLRDQFGLPGMRILQFAFDGDPENIFRPEHYIENSAAFTGTHDNNTARGWYEQAGAEAQQHARDCLGADVDASNIAPRMLQAVWRSKSALAIAPLQDVLGLDATARMNVPGTSSGNWEWRVTAEQFDANNLATLAQLTRDTERV